MLRSVSSLRMTSGSRSLRLRRRSWRARSPKSNSSVSRARGSAGRRREPTSAATASASRIEPPRNSGQPATGWGLMPWAASNSIMTSRRPAESATSRVRPANPSRNRARASVGSGALVSKRTSGATALARFSSVSVPVPVTSFTRLNCTPAFAGRHDWMLAVVRVLFVPRLDIAPGAHGRRQRLGRINDHRSRRQVVEERAGRLEEERQEVLDAAGRETVAHIPVDGTAAWIAFKARAIAPPEGLDRVRIERNLARWQQAHLAQPVAGSLRLGVKDANGLDLVVEEVDAQRRVRAHGEDVDDRAADGALAGRHHLRDLRVARLDQAQAKVLARQAVAPGQQQRVRLDVRRRRQALQQGFERDDDDAALERGQFVEDREALRNDVGMRREAVVGQGLPVGESENGEVATREESELRLQSIQSACRFHDHSERPLREPSAFRYGERRRASIELAPANPLAGGARHRRRQGHGRYRYRPIKQYKARHGPCGPWGLEGSRA